MQAEKSILASQNNYSNGNRVNSTDLDADTLLQSSRRLDWRFLLPDPELGRVVCLNNVSVEMRDSLRLFSRSLVENISIDENLEGKGKFDIVVVERLSGEKLELAAQLLRPGGYLYAENENLFMPKRKGPRLENWRLALPVSCVRAVHNAGFTHIQAYWHWPNFTACSRIIPLNDRGALRYSLLSGSRSTKGKMRSTIGRFLLWTRLLKESVSCFSVVARLD